MAKLLVLHGPNLNLLGRREPALYGVDTLADINARLERQAAAAGHALDALQSNAEHELVDAVQQAKANDVAFIVVNPAAFTHTSVALRDALAGSEHPFHRSAFFPTFMRARRFAAIPTSRTLPKGLSPGLGAAGYEYALTEALRRIDAT